MGSNLPHISLGYRGFQPFDLILRLFGSFNTCIGIRTLSVGLCVRLLSVRVVSENDVSEMFVSARSDTMIHMSTPTTVSQSRCVVTPLHGRRPQIFVANKMFCLRDLTSSKSALKLVI